MVLTAHSLSLPVKQTNIARAELLIVTINETAFFEMRPQAAVRYVEGEGNVRRQRIGAEDGEVLAWKHAYLPVRH